MPTDPQRRSTCGSRSFDSVNVTSPDSRGTMNDKVEKLKMRHSKDKCLAVLRVRVLTGPIFCKSLKSYRIHLQKRATHWNTIRSFWQAGDFVRALGSMGFSSRTRQDYVARKGMCVKNNTKPVQMQKQTQIPAMRNILRELAKHVLVWVLGRL